MEGRVVSTQDTAIEIGALFVLFLDGSDVAVPDDFYSKYIRAWFQERSYI